MTGSKTLTTTSQCKTSRMSNNSRKGPFVDTAILSMSDFDRIRKNATILSKEDEMNTKKIIEDQKILAQSNAQVTVYNDFQYKLFNFMDFFTLSNY